MTRRPLQPLDITLRHGRRYQGMRRLFLGVSVALTFGLPLWHLHALDVEGAGIAADSRWAKLAQAMPDAPPPFYGAATSIWVGVFELVDPLESLAAALFRGLSWNWVWTALPGVVLIVLLGRFFCGWACPYLPILAAANAARWVLTRLGVPLADLRVPRVTSFVVMVGVLVVGGLAGTLLVPLVYPPAIIGREVFCAIFYGSAADPLELLVSVDPYLSDSARVSDLVLPASTFAESEDVDANDKNVAGKSLVPPLPGSMPDFTILTRLAHAVGLGQYFPWATFHEAMNATHVPWMEEASMQPRPEVAEGYRPLFGTVTGKAEFASTLLERVGQSALPEWTPPTEALSAEFPLRLVTGPRRRSSPPPACSALRTHP